MDLNKIVEESTSYSEVARKLGNKYINGKIVNKIKIIVKDYNCSHFTGRSGKRIYKEIDKKCPVCGKEFKAKEGHLKEKKTCSYSCSNTYFRTGPNHGNWKDDAYRTTCFYYHQKECIICKENRIVEVHHLDHNEENNDPRNLIPLCPTHHRYWHSSFRYLVEEEVFNYIDNWKITLSGKV